VTINDSRTGLTHASMNPGSSGTTMNAFAGQSVPQDDHGV
jgi:hypothetical protein